MITYVANSCCFKGENMSLHKNMNERIADLALLNIKLHKFHWYVEGSDFYPVHGKLEELYDEVNELYDEYAERLLAIDGKPAATMKEYLQLSKISESGNEVKPKEIFTTLIADYGHFVAGLKKGIELAEDAGDNATADMFIDTVTNFEKHIWMFKQTVK